jgi:hypothetical protein
MAHEARRREGRDEGLAPEARNRDGRRDKQIGINDGKKLRWALN